MIKMKQIMDGFSYKRKFGEKLPTLKDFAKDTTEESVTEAVTPRAYSEIRGQARYLAMEIKNLNKGIKSQSDETVIDSVDYILGKAKMMKEILTDKRYK